MVHKAKQSLTVLVMKYGSKDIVTAPFESLRKGDVFFVRGESHTVEIDAHYSGDASYDGYLLYDSMDESWFPGDLDNEEQSTLRR